MDKKIWIGLAVLIALALGVWAITSTSDNSSGNDEHQSGTTSQTGNNSDQSSQPSDQTSSQPDSNSKNVNIIDFAYSPANITVKIGDTVTWTNMDSVDHTVTVTNGEGPDSELFGKGETYSYTFTNAGKYEYFCKSHPSMVGSVTVE